MEETISQRIRKLIDVEKINDNQFAKKIGVSQSVIASMFSRKTEPSSKVLVAILNAFANLSSEWLMRGKGDMKIEIQSDIDINDDTIIYHYTNLKGLFGIIGNEGIKLAELAYTNDLRETNNHCGYKCACFCVGKDAYKKPRMWAQYGDNHNGVCIGFKLGKLREQIRTLGCNVDGFKVEYKNEAFFRYKGCNNEESLHYKLDDWEKENEYRFISNETDYIPISKGCIECIYVGVKTVSDFDAITKIGMNDKLKTFMIVGGLLKENFMNAFTKKISFEETVDMNGLKIKVGHFINIKGVDDIMGRRNARRFFEEIGNMREYTHIPSDKYENIIRENERLRVENERLKNAVGTSISTDIQDAIEEKKA